MSFDLESFKEWIESDLGQDIPFDPYAQNPEEWKHLADRIPGLIISSADGIACYQAEGLLHGLPFYFKAKQGSASLSVGSVSGGFPYLPGDALYFSDHFDCSYLMSHEEFEELMLKMVPTLKRAPILWEFPCRKLEYVDGKWTGKATDEMDMELGWGHTPEEGYEATKETSAYLEQHGISVETQKRMWDVREVSPLPSPTTQLKEWPETDPEFKVLP